MKKALLTSGVMLCAMLAYATAETAAPGGDSTGGATAARAPFNPGWNTRTCRYTDYYWQSGWWYVYAYNTDGSYIWARSTSSSDLTAFQDEVIEACNGRYYQVYFNTSTSWNRIRVYYH